MRWLLLVLALFLSLSPAYGATLVASGTAPSQFLDFGTCQAGTLAAYASGTTLQVHLKWWRVGVDSLAAPEDSVSAQAGQAFSFTQQVPSGLYRVRAWASLGAEVGCDTTVTRQLGGRPYRPTLAP